MNINYIVYDERGSILRTGDCQSADLFHQAREGEFVRAGRASDDKHYIENMEIREKTEFPAILDRNKVVPGGIDSVVLEDVPAGTDVQVEDKVYRVDDGVFELSLDMPGEVVLQCRHPKHLDGEYKVEGTAQ